MLTASICHVGLAIVSVLAKKSSRSEPPALCATRYSRSRNIACVSANVSEVRPGSF